MKPLRGVIMVDVLLKVRDMFSMELTHKFAGSRNSECHRNPRRMKFEQTRIHLFQLFPVRCSSMWGALGFAVVSIMMTLSMGANSIFQDSMTLS